MNTNYRKKHDNSMGQMANQTEVNYTYGYYRDLSPELPKVLLVTQWG